jgi:integrase/recombinase XerD
MAGGDDMLSQDVQAYLAVRRAMGFAMKWSGNLLRSFAAFSDAEGQQYVRSEIAIKWAGSAPSVRTRARRLGLVIRLARYLRAEDQQHEVPPPAFGREERPRRAPYIYSREDVPRFVQAASAVGRYPNPEYRGLTYTTFFGLLACTGMRLSEAINLRLQDITVDGLVIRNTKFRKSRLIPLHPTAQAALERYLPKRLAFAPLDDHLFVGLRKHKLLRHDAYVAFRKSIEKVGIQRHPGLPRPTIHALRHTFAVRALETCPDDRDRITRHMVALSTYLGHSDIKHTYWYLEATPELMRNIAESSQRYFMGGWQ